ncbi:MAG TPA: hypothetical protein VFU22_32310 [Roseiflexaceae bacterium]|nr:hypothetical protein [Roseiflexaceae bacterium]
MAADHPPIARISHAEFQVYLTRQTWPFWAVDTSDLKPLVAYQPVSLTWLMRILKSHYTYSDIYLFNAASTQEQIRAIDWHGIPSITAAMLASYVITRSVGQPFFAIAGSYDAAQRGDIIMLLPANDETRLLES